MATLNGRPREGPADVEGHPAKGTSSASSVPRRADVDAQPFQVMPPLTADEYAALKADIDAHGVLVPVVVDQHGRTIDGHHRQRICAELGLECPTTVRTVEGDTDARDIAYRLNLLRRQLDPLAWAVAFRGLAADRGVELGKRGRHNEKTATVADLAAEVGVSPRTARRRLADLHKLATIEEEHPGLADDVRAGDLDVRRASRIARDIAAERKRTEQSKAGFVDQPAGGWAWQRLRQEVTLADDLRSFASHLPYLLPPCKPRKLHPDQAESIPPLLLREYRRQRIAELIDSAGPDSPDAVSALQDLTATGAEYERTVRDALAACAAAADRARTAVEKIAADLDTAAAGVPRIVVRHNESCRFGPPAERGS